MPPKTKTAPQSDRPASEELERVYDGFPVVPATVTAMVADIKTMITERPVDARQVSYDIIDSILSGSWEDALSGTTDIEDLLDGDGRSEVLHFTGVEWQEADRGEFEVYAVIHCVNKEGIAFVLTNGGHNVVALMYRALKEDRFPFAGRIVRKHTRQGFDTYRIVLG